MKQNMLLKNPFVLAFVLLYLIAFVSAIWLKNFGLMLLSLLTYALIALVFALTKDYKVGEFSLGKPWLGLVVFILCLGLSWVPTKFWGLPEIGGDWGWTRILINLILLILLPCFYLNLKEKGFVTFVFAPKNLKKDLALGFIVGAFMIVPTFFFNPDTWKPIISGEMGLIKVLIAFPVSLLYFFLRAGLPEEFLFRGFLQEHCAQLLKSRVSGLIMASLIFGCVHIPGLVTVQGIPVFEAFVQATLLQTVVGLFLGSIWERTHSLVPLLFLHTLIDGITNLAGVAHRLFT